MSLGKRLLSQSSIIYLARLCGAGLTLLLQIAIARTFGQLSFGEYLLIIATVNMVAIAMPLGFQVITTYFVAEYCAKAEGRQLRRFLKRAYAHVAVTGLLFIVFGRPLTEFFGAAGQVVAQHWLQTGLLAVATATIMVSGGSLVGMKRPVVGFMFDTLMRPIFALTGFALVVAAISPGQGIGWLLWALAVTSCFTAAAQVVLVLNTIKAVAVEDAPRARESRRWWYFSVPWIALMIGSDYFFDLDLLLLAGHMPHDELAIFGVGTRLFALVAFGVSAVYAVTVPDMLEADAIKDVVGFRRKIGEANLIASGLAVLLLIGVVVFSPLAFRLFGPEFAAGVIPLAILCVGLVLRSAFGPASVVISIVGRPYACLPAIGAALATLVAANMALAPHGLIGAATAALLAMTVWSAGLWFTALKVSGLDVSIVAGLDWRLAARRRSNRLEHTLTPEPPR